MAAGFCSGAGQPGTLTELIALGAADKYLTMNPSITFWRFRYLRATNYAMEAVEQTFNTQVSFGGDLQITLNRNGDLIYFLYLQVTLPGITAVSRVVNGDVEPIFDIPCTCPTSDFPGIPFPCDPCCDGQEDYTTVACGVGSGSCTEGSCKQITPPEPTCDGLPTVWAHWVNAVGQFIIETACIVIGGQPIDYLYGEFMYSWEELSGKPGKRLQEMIGKRYTRAQLIEDSAHTRVLYVPLPFWFTRTSGNALSLVSLQFHQVRVHVHLARLKDMIQRSAQAVAYEETTGDVLGPVTACDVTCFNVVTMVARKSVLGIDPCTGVDDRVIGNIVSTPDPVVMIEDENFSTGCRVITSNNIQAVLLTTYVYLDIEERDRFAVGAFEQLITQVQMFEQQLTTAQGDIQVNFNHPIIQLIWMFRRKCQEDVNNWCNFSGKYGRDPLESASLCLNNQVRYSHDAKYFRLVQPYQHHSHFPEGYIYTYSFGLYPEEPQPSGSVNFSRIDNVTFSYKLYSDLVSSTEWVRILLYGRNWNVRNPECVQKQSAQCRVDQAWEKQLDSMSWCYVIVFVFVFEH